MSTVTQSQILTRCRDMLDEASATFWTDVQIRNWINDAQRDIARRTESLIIQYAGPAVVAATQLYTLPTDIVRIHHIGFTKTGETQKYPLQVATQQEIDSIFGINQTQQGTPQYYVIEGYPGGLTAGAAVGAMKIRLFPNPSTGGTLTIQYYALPVRLATDGSAGATALSIPEGWDDLIVNFVTYMALMKDKAPEWRDHKQIYEEKVTQMIEVTRHFHDNAQSIVNDFGRFVPNWLYEFEG